MCLGVQQLDRDLIKLCPTVNKFLKTRRIAESTWASHGVRHNFHL